MWVDKDGLESFGIQRKTTLAEELLLDTLARGVDLCLIFVLS